MRGLSRTVFSVSGAILIVAAVGVAQAQGRPQTQKTSQTPTQTLTPTQTSTPTRTPRAWKCPPTPTRTPTPTPTPTPTSTPGVGSNGNGGRAGSTPTPSPFLACLPPSTATPNTKEKAPQRTAAPGGPVGQGPTFITQDLVPPTFCGYLQDILDCTRKNLTAKKGKLDQLTSDVATLDRLIKDLRDQSVVPEASLDALREQLKKKAEEKAAAEKAFDGKATARLALLNERTLYLADLCKHRGWPEAYYSLRAGLEGNFDPSKKVAIEDGHLIADFQFSSPLLWLGGRRRSLRVLSARQNCMRNDSQPSLQPCIEDYPLTKAARQLTNDESSLGTCLSALEAQKTGERDAAAADEKNALKDVAEALQATNAAIDAYECVAKELDVVLEHAVRNADPEAFRKCQEGHGSSCELVELLKEKLENADSLASSRKALETLKKSEQEAKERQAKTSTRKPLCEAAEALESFLTSIGPYDWERGDDPFGALKPVRIGPYLVPSPTKRQVAPIWGSIRLQTAELPALKAVDADPELAQRLLGSVGLYWSFAEPRRGMALGTYAAVGGIFSGAPERSPDGGRELRYRSFYELGLLSQTNYRVADVDRTNGIDAVIGEFAVGYRRAGYLRTPQPCNEKTPTHRCREADRLLADLKLTYGKASATVKPLVFFSMDWSLRGKHHYGKLGVLLDVDLQRFFSGAVGPTQSKLTDETLVAKEASE